MLYIGIDLEQFSEIAIKERIWKKGLKAAKGSSAARLAGTLPIQASVQTSL